MGRRGPAPEPAASRVRKGETRPSQVNFLEPMPPQRAPRMPAGMDDSAKRVWVRVLHDAAPGLITAADADVLRLYCEAVVRGNRAGRELARGEFVVEGRSDSPGMVRNHLHVVVKAERDAVRLFARELGLSPAARAGLQVQVGPAAGGDIDGEIGPTTRLRLLAGNGTDD
jgi:P27 family predicted phage terminase small subunit